MKNVVGTPARKESFYQRDREVRKITDRINDGNNIQIAAPRRVGKTSILFYLLDNKKAGHVYVYVDTEAIDNEQDFYKKLFKEILKTEEIKQSRKIQNLMKEGDKFFRRIKSIRALGTGIDFTEPETEIDYKEEVENLLCGIQFEKEVKLILLIDEFPQTIQNIVEKDAGQPKDALSFLKSNREIRLNPEIAGKVIFIYTGSIGLNHTVSAINGTAFINDLSSLEVGPLEKSEAHELLTELLSQKGFSIEKDVATYLLNKTEWLIPFHIQLAVQEILALAYTDPQITKSTIDKAFNNIIESRNNNHFEHYASRLKKLFKEGAFTYADELLKTVAEKGTISATKAFDLAAKHNQEGTWRQILEILMYDGYINNVGDKNIYHFNSPILKMWWQRYICN